jgi:hypothetical protein
MRRLGFAATLVAIAGLATAATPALATTAYSVRSDGDDNLYRIDLESGTATSVGPVGFSDVEGLAFDPGGRLFGFDDVTNQLITIDKGSGAGTAVGPSGVAVTDMGLDFGCTDNVFMSTDAPDPEQFYRLDPATGAGTLVGPQGVAVTGLASDGQTLFGVTGDNDNRTVTINPATGAATPVGPLGTVNLSDGGLAAAPDGRIWGIEDGGTGPLFTIDKQTGAATVQFTTGMGGFEGLAIDAPSVCYPPGVEITSGPDGATNDTTPTFTFHVSPESPANDGMTVECVINGPIGPCSDDATAHTPQPLADGFYRFTVGATARDGISGVSFRSFEVDTDPPKAGFQRRPKKESDDRTPIAVFRSDEGDDVTYRCRLDKEPVEVCPKRTEFGRVDPGTHSIRVRALDPAGNLQKPRTKRSFTVLGD